MYLATLQQGYYHPRIFNILKLDGIHISQSTVSNVKRKIGRHREILNRKLKFLEKKHHKQRPSLRKSSRKLMLKIHHLNMLLLNLFVLANLLFRTSSKILNIFFEKKSSKINIIRIIKYVDI
jgi:hypothetical protein